MSKQNASPGWCGHLDGACDDLLEQGAAVAVNLRRHGNLITWARERGLFVRVDRATPWGNRFELGKDGDRAAPNLDNCSARILPDSGPAGASAPTSPASVGHGQTAGGAGSVPVVIETAEPVATRVPAVGLCLSTSPRLLQSTVVVELPRTRPTACSSAMA